MSGEAAYCSLIAKTGGPGQWLPLWLHHRDACGIMERLLEEFVSGSIADTCGETREGLRRAALFSAAVHDIGKATAGFQYKIGLSAPERASALRHYLDIPETMDLSYVRQTPHALAGEAILKYLGCPDSIALLAGAHHGVPTGRNEAPDLSADKRDIEGWRNYFGFTDRSAGDLKLLWEMTLRDGLRAAGIDSVQDLPELGPQGQMIVTGLLITADWLASNTELFPLISVDDTGLDVDWEARIIDAWERLALPERWSPERSRYSDGEFKSSFGFLPSAVQRRMIETVTGAESPGLFILEAPMGCGKTEAALSSAELLAARCHKNGLFFGMPTQATANGIFPRIMDWAEKQSGVFYHSIQLRHGASALNDKFQSIQKGIPEEESDSGLVVHSWFCDGKKSCLADFVVATVDQLLMMALKRKHVMLLHLGLSEKVAVIDEVHAYDAYMNRYLERALRWLGAYRTPVILLSATLPAKRRMALVRAYLGQKTSDEGFEQNMAYPLLTWTDGDRIRQEALPGSNDPRTVTIEKCTGQDVQDLVARAVSQGACVGIIVNTVSRAQALAELLRNTVTEDLLLYHAQFIMPDRSAKEEELLRRIGKHSGPEERRGFVAVGTQVLEQSLDIDLDLLITDICPMDLLLQRIGRLHRHERPRPEAAGSPVCCVLTDEFDREKSGSRSIYGSWLLRETLEQLPEKIVLPEDISPLVQRVYSAFDESEEYERYIAEAQLKENRAGAFLLGKPKRSIHGLLDRSVKDSQAEASVRDGTGSVEVLAMKQFSDGSLGFMDGTRLSGAPGNEEFRRMAEQRLRLPGIFSQKWSIDRTIRELEEGCGPLVGPWQKIPLLNGQLVLFFDENNEALLSGYRLSYSPDSGLKYEKGSDEHEGD